MEKASTAFALAMLQGPGHTPDWGNTTTWQWPEELSIPAQGIGVGFDFRYPSALGLTVSYLEEKKLVAVQLAPYFKQKLYSGSYSYQVFKLSHQAPTHFPLYVGLGLWGRKENLYDRTSFGLDSWGVQLPISFQAQDERASLDIYFDYVPAIQLRPTFNIGAYYGTGVRVYGLERVFKSKVELFQEWKRFRQNEKNPSF